MKKLYKSKKNRVFSGTIGGLGEYLEVDPVLLRVAWIILSVFSGVFPGLLTYLFVAVVVPEAK